MAASFIHWVIVVAVLVAWIIPATKLLTRLGLSPLWAALIVFPPLALIGFWVLSFRAWPVTDANGKTSDSY